MKKQFITLITLLLFSISALAQVNEEAIDYTEGDDTKVLCNQPGEANEYIFKMTPAQDDVQAWKAQLQKDGEKLSHEFHTLLTNNNIRSHRMPFEFEEQLKTAACIAQYMNKQSNENKKKSSFKANLEFVNKYYVQNQAVIAEMQESIDKDQSAENNELFNANRGTIAFIFSMYESQTAK